MDLARAAARVGTQYREVSRWDGDRSFQVRVDMVGLTRDQSSLVLGAVHAHERIEDPIEPTRDPVLEAQRRCYLEVTVVRMSNVAAACSTVLDVVRAALVDTALAQHVAALEVRGDVIDECVGRDGHA